MTYICCIDKNYGVISTYLHLKVRIAYYARAVNYTKYGL